MTYAPAITAFEPLSLAEREVARLAAGGLSNERIALARRRSVHTVARQISCILGKLKLSSRHAIAALDIDDASAAADSGRPPGWGELGQREREVVSRLAHGLPQKAIAIELGVAPSTVCNTIQRIEAKLGFNSHSELVRAAARWMRAGSPADQGMRAQRTPVVAPGY
jgi:DNA-binding NarL/FixJ family response regulator